MALADLSKGDFSMNSAIIVNADFLRLVAPLTSVEVLSSSLTIGLGSCITLGLSRILALLHHGIKDGVDVFIQSWNLFTESQIRALRLESIVKDVVSNVFGKVAEIIGVSEKCQVELADVLGVNLLTANTVQTALHLVFEVLAADVVGIAAKSVILAEWLVIVSEGLELAQTSSVTARHHPCKDPLVDLFASTSDDDRCLRLSQVDTEFRLVERRKYVGPFRGESGGNSLWEAACDDLSDTGRGVFIDH